MFHRHQGTQCGERQQVPSKQPFFEPLEAVAQGWRREGGPVFIQRCSAAVPASRQRFKHDEVLVARPPLGRSQLFQGRCYTTYWPPLLARGINMLNNSTFDPQRGFLLDGTAAHVNLGRLQTPDEFAGDCLATVQRPHFGSWALSTQLPDEMVHILQSPLVPNNAELMVMASEQGILYPVVTLQSAGLQVRLLQSLASPATQDWFRAVTSDGTIRIALEIPEANQVAVVSMPCNLRPGADVENMIRRCAVVDREAFLRDAAQTARHLANLDGMPSLIQGFETQEVRLVLVLETGPGFEQSKSHAKARVLN